MGNKTNSNAMRIGVNKGWNSLWYADKSSYAGLILEDKKIRSYLEKRLKPAGLALSVIKRNSTRLTVDLTVARPGIVIGRGGSGIEEIEKDIANIVKGKVIKIKVFEVKRPEIVAKLIGENIAAQIERRMSPKRAMEKAAEAAMNTGLVKGVAIWVRGRIRGVDMARKLEYKVGSVPRHTIRADIDFAQSTAQLPQGGTHGIKVWVNRGEKHTYEVDLT